jgi:hypothetical protein
MKLPIACAFLLLLGASALEAQITYFDAPSHAGGTTQVNSGITAVWQQFDGTNWINFDDSLSTRAYNSGNWELRVNGPATNAANTTAYQVGDGDVAGGRDAAQVRVLLSGIDPADSVEIFVYNATAAGVAAIQATVTTDIAATGLYSGLTTYSSGGTAVLANGDEGTSAGDQRIRYSAATGLTGVSSFAVVLDDFAGPGPGDRATLDGIGIRLTSLGTPPSFGAAPAAFFGSYGDTASITYPATGNPPPSYQWQYSATDGEPWSDLPDQESDQLSLPSAGPAANGYYRVVATNAADSVASPSVQVALSYPAPVVAPPARVTGTPGQALAVPANATGIGNLSYEWYRITTEGDLLLAESSDTLGFGSFTQEDAGTYYVVVTDDGTGVSPGEFPISSYSTNITIVADPGPIAYFDAPSSESGTTQVKNGITAVWQQFDGTNWVDFDDSLSARGFNSGAWEYRDTGPAANASGTTIYTSVDTAGDSAQIRVVLSGFNPAATHDFFFYNARSAGAAKIRAGLTPDTTAADLYGDLSDFITTGTLTATVEQVLADGTPGDPGAGDRRFRTLAFSGVTGSSSYAFVFDDFDSGTVGDRASLDGIGIGGLEPLAGFAAWIDGYEVGALTGIHDDPDGDGLANGVENFLGTDPSQPGPGLGAVTRTDDGFTFQHPENPQPADDLVAVYLWSQDLLSWHASGTESGGSVVTFSRSPDSPANGITTVTATATGTVPTRLFTRIEVSPAP